MPTILPEGNMLVTTARLLGVNFTPSATINDYGEDTFHATYGNKPISTGSFRPGRS